MLLLAEDQAFGVLAEVARLPTAPMHEMAVARHLRRVFAVHGVPLQRDSFGNLLARFRRGGGARPLALVAHMDHPGFVVTAAREGEATATVLGGLRPSVLAAGTRVRLYHGDWSAPAEITGSEPATAGERRRVTLRFMGGAPAGAFGMLALPGCLRAGNLLLLRAADDLAQCAAMVLVLQRLLNRERPADVTFVFTRAEEIGLVGATLLAQSGLLPSETIVFSLECSRTLPGAKIGGGPVIRVGDAVQSFDAEAEAVLLAAREELERTSQRPVQRQLMSGGSCEATAFQTFGYVTGGVALPLGNYHNAGPDGRAVSEQINLQDLLGEVELLATAALLSGRPPRDRRSRLRELAAPAADGLLASARAWEFGLPLAGRATPSSGSVEEQP